MYQTLDYYTTVSIEKVYSTITEIPTIKLFLESKLNFNKQHFHIRKDSALKSEITYTGFEFLYGKGYLIKLKGSNSITSTVRIFNQQYL